MKKIGSKRYFGGFLAVASMLAMFLAGFIVLPVFGLNNHTILRDSDYIKYDSSKISLYNPCIDGGDSNNTGNCYHGKEVTWEDLNQIPDGETDTALKLLVSAYGELAMELQREYGVPWEMVFMQMGRESGAGVWRPWNDETGRWRSIALNIRDKDGRYNLLGMDANREKNKWMSDEVYSYTDADNGSSHTAAEYDDISTMIIGYAVAYYRNGNTNYGRGLEHWGYKDY